MKRIFPLLCLLSASCVASDPYSERLHAGEEFVTHIVVNANEASVISLKTKNQLWVGFDILFPEEKLKEYEGKYIFKIKDRNGFSGLSTGAEFGNPHAGTLFNPKKGEVSVSYENLSGESYSVVFWKKKHEF